MRAEAALPGQGTGAGRGPATRPGSATPVGAGSLRAPPYPGAVAAESAAGREQLSRGPRPGAGAGHSLVAAVQPTMPGPQDTAADGSGPQGEKPPPPGEPGPGLQLTAGRSPAEHGANYTAGETPEPRLRVQPAPTLPSGKGLSHLARLTCAPVHLRKPKRRKRKRLERIHGGGRVARSLSGHPPETRALHSVCTTVPSSRSREAETVGAKASSPRSRDHECHCQRATGRHRGDGPRGAQSLPGVHSPAVLRSPKSAQVPRGLTRWTGLVGRPAVPKRSS